MRAAVVSLLTDHDGTSVYHFARVLLMARSHTGANRTASRGVPIHRQIAAVEHTQDRDDLAHHWEAVRRQVRKAEAVLLRAAPSLEPLCPPPAETAVSPCPHREAA